MFDVSHKSSLTESTWTVRFKKDLTIVKVFLNNENVTGKVNHEKIFKFFDKHKELYREYKESRYE